MEKIPNNTEPEVESEAELAPEPEAEPIPKADAEKSPKIKTRSVAELEEPIRVLFEQLSSKFEQGEYTYIVGDDASGRIPALIFEEVAKKISERRTRLLLLIVIYGPRRAVGHWLLSASTA